MSTHRLIDKVCIVITVLAVLLTALFMNGSKLGLAAADTVSYGYEDKLFDDSYVHSIDIEIDDWDALIENAAAEEYSIANVTIDGEVVKGVGVRAKGNTSLSTVSQLDSERYSLKIEFDSYQDGNTYYGLDKLCLNNLIQDYTMMKDYIAYKLMNEFGVDAPLSSFCFVTVNGEDWGLFLAVEAVEDSFLERNYGTNHGDLYKPDSMSMGGGRGNGGDFDMRDMDFDEMGMKNPFERDEDSEDADGTGSDESTTNDDSPGEMSPPDGFEMPEDFDPSQMGGFPGGGGENSGGPGGGFPGGGGFGMGSSDAKLQYIDDDTDSYSTIFDSAKTTVSKADKKRLINSLQNLSEGIEEGDADKISEAVDVEAVMRYMVVHNFVVNGDSYTGSMIHNYYLYEEDGLMSMIPWDYNLAYGTFQSDDSDSAVNDPIDTPLSITEGSTDRPMFSWITSNDEYLEMYHEYYAQFLEQFYTSGYLTDLVNNTYEMIAEYVDRDPTKFCTTEEFETAVDTIRTFLELRCESIQGQLDGTIGSTDAEQEADSSTLIDASGLNLSDMGSMGGGGGGHDGGGPGGGHSGDHDKSSGGPGGSSENDSNSDKSSHSSGKGGHHDKSSDKSSENSSASSENSSSENSRERGGMPGDFPGFGGGFPSGDMPDFGGNDFLGGDFPGGSFGSSVSATDWIYVGASAAALLAAILFALKYRARR